MWLLFCLAALVGSLSTIRKLNAENNALRDQLEAQADTLIVINSMQQKVFNDAVNFGQGFYKITDTSIEYVERDDVYKKTLHDYNESCNFEPYKKYIDGLENVFPKDQIKDRPSNFEPEEK